MLTRSKSAISIAMATALLCVAAVLLPAFAQENSEATKNDAALLQGTWAFVLLEQNGIKQPLQKLRAELKTITFLGTKFEVKRGDEVIQVGTQKIDAGNNPKTIDLDIAEGEGKGTVRRGIYVLKRDTLTICLDQRGKKRPTEFQTDAASGYFLATLKREWKAGVAGVDPKDASIVYDKPRKMGKEFTAYNGKAYDKVRLSLADMLKAIADADARARGASEGQAGSRARAHAGRAPFPKR
jgi:uncharacterized protein (TIGR03067 family)